MSKDQEPVTVSELLAPGISLLRPWILIGPLALAAIAGVVGFLVAPEIRSDEAPEWLTSGFGTAAQIIATLMVALALEARYVDVKPATAGFTVGYVAFGLIASVTGMSASLPHDVYPVLLAVTTGCGVGAIASVALLGFAAFRAEATRVRSERVALIANPTALGPRPNDQNTQEGM